MTFRKRDVLFLSILNVSFFCIASCTIEAPGISVKTYREPAVVMDAAEKEQQEMTEAIQQMNLVKENSAFTEKAGVPEYIIGPGDVISILYWTPSRDEGFKQTTYTTTVRPDGKISFIFADDIVVSGRTAREIDDILTGLAQKYMRDPRIEVVVKDSDTERVVKLICDAARTGTARAEFGRRAAARRNGSIPGRERAARHQQTDLPDVEGLVPGRQGHLGHGGSQGRCRR